MIFKIIKLALLVVVIYVAFMLTLPWIKFFIFKAATVEIISNQDKISRKTLKSSIREQADDLNIALPEKAVTIKSLGGANSYIVVYSDNVTFPLINKSVIFKHKIEKIQQIKGEK